MDEIDPSVVASVREAVLECLQAVLAPQDDVRRAGEEHIRVLEVKDGEILARCGMREPCYDAIWFDRVLCDAV